VRKFRSAEFLGEWLSAFFHSPITDHHSLTKMRPARLERATYSFGGCHSIQLSYGRGLKEINELMT
jgi:hypothetical protein